MPASSDNVENNGKDNGVIENSVEVLAELDKEVKDLREEKVNLINIEEILLVKINEEIENKEKIRDELKKQIEELRIRCEELIKIFNSLTKA